MDPATLTNEQIAAMPPATLQAALQQMRDRALQENMDAQNALQQLAAERARPIQVQPAPVTVNQPNQKPKPPKPASYEGVRNVEAINEWTRSVSQYCSYYNLNFEDSLQTAAMFLTKDASTWWHYYLTGVRAGSLPGF